VLAREIMKQVASWQVSIYQLAQIFYEKDDDLKTKW
jgi:hypothetical protein